MLACSFCTNFTQPPTSTLHPYYLSIVFVLFLLACLSPFLLTLPLLLFAQPHLSPSMITIAVVFTSPTTLQHLNFSAPTYPTSAGESHTLVAL
mmetsp:Transcript_39902/g.102810  ORF Transcript_39902/g.102810 Transcript_39902/m.102810 type:complete len:93 (+) Transcript_39902:3596-3874(+)